jgi:glycosyltransferase involved in cell wall biosynthesis
MWGQASGVDTFYIDHHVRKFRMSVAARERSSTTDVTSPLEHAQVSKQQRPYLSVVIPVLNEADSIPILYEEINEVLQPLGKPYEIIFVDDGSRDRTPTVLRKFHAADPQMQVIQFRKNFGKSAALSAGFDVARGEIIITMDGDLQDVPGEIPKLLQMLDEDTDLVSGWKHPRNDPISKRLPSGIFNAVVRMLTGITIHDFNCGFKAYRAEVTREIPLYGELHRYIPVLAHNKGFRVTETKVRHRSRKYGSSKFGGGRFFRGFFDLVTVLFLTQYNLRPLHFFGWFGVSTFTLGFIINSYLAILWFLGQPIGTRPLLTLGVLLMIIGGQFFVFGLLAEMIASTTHRSAGYSIRRHLSHDNQSGEPGDND